MAQGVAIHDLESLFGDDEQPRGGEIETVPEPLAPSKVTEVI